MSVKEKSTVLGLTLIGVLAGLFVVSILLDFGLEGTDDRASGAIGELRPDYQPWFQNVFEPGEQAEKVLFAFQILLGVGIGWYSLWALRRKNRAR